jgi:streptogramin lyase
VSPDLPTDELWVLVHPTDAPPEGPGVVRLDGRGAEIARLPLPAELTSPHGLAYDGDSLWLTGFTEERGGIYELNPVTGFVRSALDAEPSKGIAVDGDGLWVHDATNLIRIDHSGAVTQKRQGRTNIQDVAFDGTDVLYLTNREMGMVTRVSPANQATTLANPVTRGGVSDAFAIWDGALWVVDHALGDEEVPTGTTVLREVDPHTGLLLSSAVLRVEGWVTAIAR